MEDSPHCKHLPVISHSDKSREDVMTDEYYYFLESTEDYAIKGFIVGAVLGLCALKNKRKNMFRWAAIGSGSGAGYAL
jgi:hypothetical protein